MSFEPDHPIAADTPDALSLTTLLAGLANECAATERTARAVDRTIRKRDGARPGALRRTSADADLSLFAGGRSFALVDTAEFYTSHAVEDLRGRTFSRDEPRPARTEDGYPPDVHTVIARVPCPATTARAAEIVAAFDTWTAASREVDQAMAASAMVARSAVNTLVRLFDIKWRTLPSRHPRRGKRRIDRPRRPRQAMGSAAPPS